MAGGKRLWLITGEPGVGKTSVVNRLSRILSSQGLTIGGMTTREIRRKGERIGFEILDLATNQRGILSSKELSSGPRLGRYRVNLKDLAEVGAKAIERAIERSDIIVCDEIGPMELISPDFRRVVASALRCGKPLIAVIHKRMRDPIIEEAKSSTRTSIHEVTFQNRESLPELIAEEVKRELSPL